MLTSRKVCFGEGFSKKRLMILVWHLEIVMTNTAKRKIRQKNTTFPLVWLLCQTKITRRILQEMGFLWEMQTTLSQISPSSFKLARQGSSIFSGLGSTVFVVCLFIVFSPNTVKTVNCSCSDSFGYEWKVHRKWLNS